MKEEKNKNMRIHCENNPAAPWMPTYKWFIKTAAIILAALIAIFFALNIILKPYMRQIPAEITPWLDENK